MSRVRNILKTLSSDAGALRAFEANPSAWLDGHNLNEDERGLILSNRALSDISAGTNTTNTDNR